MSSLELRRKDIGKRHPASQRSEVVALVIVGAAGGGQESPIFEFLPFAWLSQVEITPEAAAAVSEREGGGRVLGWHQWLWLLETREGGAISGFLLAPLRANFEPGIVPTDRRND